VNDSLGHNLGDLLLVESARRLIACVRSEDLVARLGGDEFVILIEDMEDSSEVVKIAQRILNDLGMPADLDGHLVFVSASIGIVFNDARYERPADILRDADISMYHAKRQGRGRYSIFNPEMLDGVMTRVLLEADLRKALENQEFVVYYQSIIDLSTHQTIGFEALLRWQHPTRGLILPAEFISTAEEIGLIVPIGYWVLDEACRQIRNWQEQYPHDPPLTVNVNISMKQCVEIDFVERIVGILKNNNLDASCLKLELMEHLILENSEYISTILSKLDELGIKVQIDDFGTGYLLLGYLHTLPIDTLKINRAFISRLGNNDEGSEIVQTILTMAHGFGMKVVAEGVETDEQLSQLKLMECEYVQGFLFAKPVNNQEAGKLLGNPFP
jgi:diguanylate cyclase (GGDEF)-like protein